MVTRETMIFPCYHQLDSTRKLIAAARAEGPGQNYLIQHSTGSGKTKDITINRVGSVMTAISSGQYPIKA